MTIPRALAGAYSDVESLKRLLKISVADYDDLILQHLNAASRDVEQKTLRRFYPYLTTAYLRWPSLSVQSTWMLWAPDDLLSVSLLQAAASGNGAVPVTITHYLLEPNEIGPPYSRVEVDLSYSDVFTSGPTPQRSIALTGSFGYCDTTIPAGTLGAAITTTTATTLTCSDASKIGMGNLLLIDSEAIYVDAPRVANSATVTIRRGMNGTTAATHSNAAPISKYVPPDDVQRLVRADAIGAFQQDQAAWARTVGSGETAAEFQGRSIEALRKSVVINYRRTRTAAV